MTEEQMVRITMLLYACNSRRVCARPVRPCSLTLAALLQAPVEDATERVRASIAGASDLQVQQRSCNNAWDLYRRTRPAASPESAARARNLEVPGPHPLLAAACPTYTQGDVQAQVRHQACVKGLAFRQVSRTFVICTSVQMS